MWFCVSSAARVCVRSWRSEASFLSLLLLLVASSGCAGGDDTDTKDASPPPSPSVPTSNGGPALYRRHACQSCHGTDGGGGLGPNVTSSTSAGIGAWTAAEIVAVVRSGVDKAGKSVCATMPRLSPEKISDTDLEALVEYVRSLPAVEIPNRGTSCP